MTSKQAQELNIMEEEALMNFQNDYDYKPEEWLSVIDKARYLELVRLQTINA